MTREPRLTFGKHRGSTLAECPADYVGWLTTSDKVPAIWRELARRHLGLDPVEVGPEPSAEAPAVLFPRLVFLWWESMTNEHANNPAALAVVDRGFERLKLYCAQVTGRRFPTDAEFAAARAELEREEQERRGSRRGHTN
ncbi:MAG TPA: hypothetical protein VGE74_21060 [Gemmata sp.]